MLTDAKADQVNRTSIMQLRKLINNISYVAQV